MHKAKFKDSQNVSVMSASASFSINTNVVEKTTRLSEVRLGKIFPFSPVVLIKELFPRVAKRVIGLLCLLTLLLHLVWSVDRASAADITTTIKKLKQKQLSKIELHDYKMRTVCITRGKENLGFWAVSMVVHYTTIYFWGMHLLLFQLPPPLKPYSPQTRAPDRNALMHFDTVKKYSQNSNLGCRTASADSVSSSCTSELSFMMHSVAHGASLKIRH